MTLPTIEFRNVNVRYRVPRESLSGLKEYAIRKLKGQISYETYWALKNVSFEVNPGEIFGIIGRNGSGKSTTLKVIARVLHPTSGRVITRGRLAPLLELGGGFHFELTGRENIFLNGALLGYTRKEILEYLPEIIEFSELEEFIDAPLRTYSTGMVARLGFAVATCKRPDILLVDEVLSVGDSNFQRKCIERMVDYNAQGSTIVFVSHSLELVQSFCTKAVWLENGVAQITGDVADVTTLYRAWQEKGTKALTAPKVEIETNKQDKDNADTEDKDNIDNQETESIFRDVSNDYWAAEAINYLYKNALLAGYSDRTFRPDLAFSRFHLSVAAMRLVTGSSYSPPFAKEKIFEDVPLESPIANWLEQAYLHGLTIADKGERFWPEQGATRAEMAYILCKAIYGTDFEPPQDDMIISDVPNGYWAERWIKLCVREQLIPLHNPENRKFAPELPMTRAEAAGIIVNFHKKKFNSTR